MEFKKVNSSFLISTNPYTNPKEGACIIHLQAGRKLRIDFRPLSSTVLVLLAHVLHVSCLL